MADDRQNLSALFQFETPDDIIKERGEIGKQLEEELANRVKFIQAKGWISRKPRGDFWLLLMHIKFNMIYSDLDCLGISTGSEGAGKSNFDLLTGAIIDETFEPDTLRSRMLYDYMEVDSFYEYEPQYSYGFVDEGGIFGARDFMNADNRALAASLMVAREGHNNFIMVNIPYFGEIDTFIRNQRLRFVIRSEFVYDQKLRQLKQGIFQFYTKSTSQMIGKDHKGKLKFPRPDSVGYCPKVGGDLWRAYKEVAVPHKKGIRDKQRKNVEVDRGKKKAQEEKFGQ